MPRKTKPTPSTPSPTATSPTPTASPYDRSHYDNRPPHPDHVPSHSTPSSLTSPDSRLEKLASLLSTQKDQRPPGGDMDSLTLAALRLNILTRYSQGYTVPHIAHDLDLSTDAVQQHIQKALSLQVQYHATPTAEHNFAKYAHSGYTRIHSMTRLINTVESKPERGEELTGADIQGVIRAHKACWDIEKDILSQGISMGVIQGKAQENTADILQRTPEDLRDIIKKKLLTLATLLDRVDNDTARSFQRRRSSSLYPHTPILLQPLRSPYGIVFGVRDWKFRKGTGTSNGEYIPVAQREHLHDPSLTHTSPDQHILLVPSS